MAGPWRLGPGESKSGIPTWGFGGTTTVNVEVEGGGNSRVRLQAGGSPSEESDVSGQKSFDRKFGGVYLTITNIGFRTIIARTA